MTTTRKIGAGTSDPLDFRYHRPVAPAGTALASGEAISWVVAIAGAFFVRHRGKFTVAGTMTFQYLRPRSVRTGDDDGYSTTLDPPHADVAVVAATEFLVDIEPGGESDLLITFTPADDGTVTFFDTMQQ